MGIGKDALEAILKEAVSANEGMVNDAWMEGSILKFHWNSARRNNLLSRWVLGKDGDTNAEILGDIALALESGSLQSQRPRIFVNEVCRRIRDYLSTH